MIVGPNAKEITPKAYLDQAIFATISVAQYHAPWSILFIFWEKKKYFFNRETIHFSREFVFIVIKWFICNMVNVNELAQRDYFWN